MPEYLAPGVFVEETSFRAKSIEGVGTSVAALVGPTRFGPLRGVPEVITSFEEFTRVFGDAASLSYAGAEQPNHTAIGARGFFDNGGKQLFVTRVVKGVNQSGTSGDDSSAARASKTDTSGRVTFRARFPGRYGNVTLEQRWRDSENLIKSESVAAPAPGAVVLLVADGVPGSAFAAAPAVAGVVAADSLSIRALVTLTGATYTVEGTKILIVKDGEVVDDVQPVGLTLTIAGLPPNHRLVQVVAKRPASGDLADGTAATLSLSAPLSGLEALGVSWPPGVTTLRGTLNAAGTEFRALAAPLTPGLGAPVTINLSALGAAADIGQFLIVNRTFDLDVLNGGASGEVVFTYPGISTAPAGESSLASKLAALPARRSDRLSSPVAAAISEGATAAQVYQALVELFPPVASLDGTRFFCTLGGGTDGEAPVAADYAGEIDPIKGSTGLAALEDVEDISIVATPFAATLERSAHSAVVMELQKHVRKTRYRMGIVDSEAGMSISEVRAFRSSFDDSRLALYYPWIVTADPTGASPEIVTPPSGFIAGVYAFTDVDRGVHKAPANEVVVGALRFETEINRFQQELLNPDGINCLRAFPGRGLRVWGGRTLSSDPEWKYVNVRRYFLFLERSIEKATQWVVFEPNGEQLWANVRATVDSFLYNEWRLGHLLGGDPKQAYFVRCDRSTMTQNDLDNGRLVCVIGVAPLRPAEFVVFRIGQKTADA
ncbi:MAG TPA: phage tail sheath subtilisin-like domain-containing protein [Polyangiaceae bacterium]|nr:phage tail sheath subtilisin-like domain-containing protein [Polyangiaceae bacterium]